MKKSLQIVLVILLVMLLSITSVFAADYKIKIANPSTPSDSCVMAFYYFEKLVESRSSGRIDVQVFDSGQLGSHRDYIEGLQMGSIEMAEITTSVFSAIDDQFMIFDLPYIVKDMDHLRRIIETGVGERLSKVLEEKAGIKIVGWMIRTPRSVYSAKGPINSPEDFKGLKIRVMQSPAMLKTMEVLGAKPIPIAATERYMALQTGVVDAAENSPALIISEKEYEVVHYVSLTEHFCTPNTIAISTKFLNKLPTDLQEIVIKSAEDAANYQRGVEKQQYVTALKTFKDLGLEVNVIEDKTPFIEKVKPVYEMYKDQIGEDLINVFLETK